METLATPFILNYLARVFSLCILKYDIGIYARFIIYTFTLQSSFQNSHVKIRRVPIHIIHISERMLPIKPINSKFQTNSPHSNMLIGLKAVHGPRKFRSRCIVYLSRIEWI